MKKFREIEFRETFDMIVAIATGCNTCCNHQSAFERRNTTVKINLRDPSQKPKYDSPVLVSPINFEYKNKTVLLVEDRIKNRCYSRFCYQSFTWRQADKNLCRERQG